ncbi:longitudinals lacking protein, isoforms A/B/D/L-like isoform X3 [Arctopsyche grandis]|uniref:longitudinals lacking protein, isoforms A/B/D/L-like isoform X3 n=1 Tax=Arctopsyche grandis TaxID=121162 RepID=UPI00406D7BC8
MAGLEDDQQFCLRWNNHQSTLISVFDTLLEKGIHVDCTLAAEGRTLNAHKVVLSACSPYFEAVLSQQYDKHPIIILKDVKFAELRAMMDYMYRGEVNISQDQLGALLKAAESLQIKGLSDNKPPPTTPPASSPPLKVRSTRGSPVEEEGSRDGSVSPSRRKRKRHRSSLSPVTELPRAITPPATLTNCSDSQPDDIQKKIEDAIDTPAILTKTENNIDNNVEPKAEFTFDGNEDSVEDLTMDEDADSETEQTGACSSQPVPDGGNVPGFTWQVDRSHDETTAVPEGPRDTQVDDVSFTRIGGLSWEQWSARLALPMAGSLRESNSPTLSGNGFACPDCGRVYKLKSSLRNHQKWECGKEPQFQCPHCVYRAKQKMHIARHMERMHREKVYAKQETALRSDNLDACT